MWDMAILNRFKIDTEKIIADLKVWQLAMLNTWHENRISKYQAAPKVAHVRLVDWKNSRKASESQWSGVRERQ